MNRTYDIIRGCIILAVFIWLIGWFMWRWLKNSADPALVIFRWVLTAGILGALAYGGAVSQKYLQAGDYAAFLLVIYCSVAGLALAIIWAPVITGAVGNLFGSLLDGGSREIEPKPYYSIFRAKRTKGRYFEALTEVRKQLEKFPHDFEGHMLLAELQAENLDDLPGAGLTIHRLIALPELAPLNVAYALNRLADWHLSLTKDRDAAQATLEEIIEKLPDTEMALRAAQRIAHLADTERMLEPQHRKRIDVKAGVKNLGLQRGENGRLRAPVVDQEKMADAYVTHLQQHPLDTHAREQLAMIYARHYQRLDLAVEQLEQLITQPAQPAKLVIHWLNLMADLQVQHGGAEEQARATLQRIVDLYPDAAAAGAAQRRMDVLKLEFKGKEKGTDVQMGTYEQNIGLKRKSPAG